MLSFFLPFFAVTNVKPGLKMFQIKDSDIHLQPRDWYQPPKTKCNQLCSISVQYMQLHEGHGKLGT